MNIAISPCITFQWIIKLRWGFVCILLETFYPIDQLSLNPLKHFLFQPSGGPLTEADGCSNTFWAIFQSYCAL